ncbi:MAG: hypothetical protein QOG04_2105 [Actinomycetota bacterium]|jgi:hypothetical protein|nr:hypothetical protein [Actinomycetota bacterium]
MLRFRGFAFLIAASVAASMLSVSTPAISLASRAPQLRNAPAKLGTRIHVPARFRAGMVGRTIQAQVDGGTGTSTTAPAFDTFKPPAGMAMDAGEPSIGVNWNTGNIMFQAYTETDRVTIDDSSTPPTATWTDVSAPNAVISLDPILFTDPVSGITSTSQLLSSLYVPTGGCSLAMVTSDDGETWLPSTGCGVPGSYDHQTIGGGAYADPSAHPQALEDRATYYCGQNGYMANCSLSTDGGITYGPGIPTYTDVTGPVNDAAPGGVCIGLHGHIKVGPDGTAYLPNFGCNEGGTDLQGVVVSEDDGLTWDARTVPGALYNDFKSDPSVGISTDSTLYFAYEPKDGPVQVVVSHDKGETWTQPIALGSDLNVAYGVFPAVVAGDPDRAAVAYIGTPDATNLPNDYENKDYAGAWHLYVSTTYDGGQTWTTTDTTPTDPVQRGCVWWGNPGGCPSGQRNLLDFMDATLDQYGRVVVGYADGCINACVTGGANTQEDIGAIARQSAGLSMYTQYDSMFTPAV